MTTNAKTARKAIANQEKTEMMMNALKNEFFGVFGIDKKELEVLNDHDIPPNTNILPSK